MTITKTRPFFKQAWRLLKSRGVIKFKHCCICGGIRPFARYCDNEKLVCIPCGSIGRQRAIYSVMHHIYPNWQSCIIHEPSPPLSSLHSCLSRHGGYIPTIHRLDKKPGSFIKGFRCENLESTTFEDESLDIVLTQDVLEHVLHPKRAFIDIARTLKPGGAHIFTVPIDGRPTSITRAKIENGILVHKHPPIYHNDEFNNDCSLVITDWGLDIIDTIRYASGLTTTHLLIRDTFVGIEGRHRNDIYNEVFVTRKPLSVY